MRLAGGDLLVLQVAAWSQMILTRAPVMGMTEAVSTTFDGAHPCRMCQALEQTREQERASSSTKPPVPEPPPLLAKLLLVEGAEITAPSCPPSLDTLSSHGWHLPHWHDRLRGKPATPPPRARLS